MTLIYQDEIVIVSDAIVASMVVYDLSTQPNYDSIFLDLVESTCILVTNQVSSGSSLSWKRLQRPLVFLVFCVL